MIRGGLPLWEGRRGTHFGDDDDDAWLCGALIVRGHDHARIESNIPIANTLIVNEQVRVER